MTESIEQAALKAARIRAIHEFGPAVGEYRSAGDIKAAYERMLKRHGHLAEQIKQITGRITAAKG